MLEKRGERKELKVDISKVVCVCVYEITKKYILQGYITFYNVMKTLDISSITMTTEQSNVPIWEEYF